MKITKKQRTQLIVNASLMLLTLFALVTCIYAWFFVRIEVYVEESSLQVDRYFSGGTERIIFPCATKITDTETTPNHFDSSAVVVRDYQVYGEGQVGISVTCEGPGMLAYICDSTSASNFYELITQDLTEKLGADKSKWTYDNMKNALDEINTKTTGDVINGDTYFRIVYWVEYDEIQSSLGSADGASYWQSSDEYCAKLDLYFGDS